jgi:hypothetical protein
VRPLTGVSAAAVRGVEGAQVMRITAGMPAVTRYAVGRVEFLPEEVVMQPVRAMGFVLVLLAGTLAAAAPGDWERVGKPGAWRGVLAGTALGGTLYAVETDGRLYATDPATGAWQQVGKADFRNTRFLFAASGRLYSIEQDGSLYRINPADGTWQRVGDAGAWKATVAGTVLAGTLYTAEAGGGLYATDLATGAWRQLGKPEFGNTRLMFDAGGRLHTIESDGSLYRVNPADGSWQRVGPKGAWRGVLAGAVVNGRLYAAESDGRLYETDPVGGGWRQLGQPQFGGTRLMFNIAEQLYSIERDGSLYRISVR